LSKPILETERRSDFLVLLLPSEQRPVRTLTVPHAINMTSDSEAWLSITVDPLTLDELRDVEASRREEAAGESMRFRYLDDVFEWLDSEPDGE